LFNSRPYPPGQFDRLRQSAVAQGVARRFPDLLRRARVEHAAVDVADQAELAAVAPLDLGDVHPALRVERVQRVGSRLHQLVEDRHEVAVGVLDHVVAQIAVAAGELGQAGRDEFGKPRRAHERPGVETVVGAEREAVEPARSAAGARGRK